MRFSLILFSLGLFLLHALLPHNHHLEMNISEHERTHKEANSLIDFLALSLHADQQLQVPGEVQQFKAYREFQPESLLVHFTIPENQERFLSKVIHVDDLLNVENLSTYVFISLKHRGPPAVC